MLIVIGVVHYLTPNMLALVSLWEISPKPKKLANHGSSKHWSHATEEHDAERTQSGQWTNEQPVIPLLKTSLV